MKFRSLILFGLIFIVTSVAPTTGAAPAATDLLAIADDTAHITNAALPFRDTETNLWVGGSKARDTDPCGEQLETFLKVRPKHGAAR